MYRFKAHHHTGTTLTSIRFESLKECNEVLETIVNTPGIVGGHIEQMVQGIGWVLCEEALSVS